MTDSSTAVSFPPRSYLYVPASDAHKISKGLASQADMVVLDLEDSVAPRDRDLAVRQAVQALSGHDKPMMVRIRSVRSEGARRDVEALAALRPEGLRIAKCEGVDDVRCVVDWLGEAAGRIGLYPIIESARAVTAVEALAGEPHVRGLCIGEADLRADLLATAERVYEAVGIRCVIASRSVGLDGPVQSVYRAIADLEGLRESCLAGRGLGFSGRSAIHPDQVHVINEVFTPTRHEVQWAESVLSQLSGDSESASATGMVGDEFVDPAMLRLAQKRLALAARYGVVDTY